LPNHVHASPVVAFKWNVADQFLSQALGFAFNIIMVRLLSPTEFGLFAVPMVIFLLARTLQDGATTNLIFRKQNPSLHLMKSIYGFTTLLTIIIGILLFFLIAPISAWWTNQPEANIITKYLSIGFLFTIPMIFHETVFKKRMDFKSLFVISIIATTLSGILGIILAYKGLGVWSLVIKQLAFILCSFIGYTLKLKWQEGISFEFEELWKHKSFTLPLIADQTFSFAVRNIDSLLVSRYLGGNALGIYDRAYKFLTLPIQQVGGAFSRVMLPSMSNIQDKMKLQQMFLTICGVVSLILFPLMAGLFVLSEHFVLLILTPKWRELIPLLKVFAILACFQTISTLVGNLFVIGGNTKEMFKFSLFTKPIYILVFIITTVYYRDLFLLALFYAISSIIFSFPLWHLAGKAIELKLSSILKAILPQAMAAFIMALILYLVKTYAASDITFFNFFTLMITGILSFYLMMYISKNKAFQEAKHFLKLD